MSNGKSQSQYSQSTSKVRKVMRDQKARKQLSDNGSAGKTSIGKRKTKTAINETVQNDATNFINNNGSGAYDTSTWKDIQNVCVTNNDTSFVRQSQIKKLW